MPNPYGITEVDVPGLLAGFEAQQDRRYQRMLQQRQIQLQDKELERAGRESEVWERFNNRQPGGVAAAADTMSAPGVPPAPGAAPTAQPGATGPAYDPWDDPVAQRELIAGLSGLIEPKQVLELRAAFRDATNEQREAAAASWDVIGSAALELRQLPEPERPAEFERLIPLLRTMNIPEELFAQVDLSDQGLESIVNQSRDIEKVIAGRTPDVQAVPGVGLYPVTPGSPFPDFGTGGARPEAQIGPAATIQEGQTATNQQTGERLIYQGGQWVPMTGDGGGNATGGF